MKKVIVSLGMALVFAVATATASFAKDVECTVDSVDGGKVTMTCEKSDVKAGDKVKVTSGKKGGKVEGC